MRRYVGYIIRKIGWIVKKRGKHINLSNLCNVNLKCELEGYNSVGDRTILYNSKLGKYSYVGKNSNVIYTTIGRFCSIGDNFSILAATHPIKKFVSTSPMFYSTAKQNGISLVKEEKFQEVLFRDNEKKISVEIGSDVWIGNDVSIKGGVKIGNGAVIGAKSLVMSDVEDYAIYAGIPAKKISERFTREEQLILQKSEWWLWDERKLGKHAHLFSDIEKFIEGVYIL